MAECSIVSFQETVQEGNTHADLEIQVYHFIFFSPLRTFLLSPPLLLLCSKTKQVWYQDSYANTHIGKISYIANDHPYKENAYIQRVYEDANVCDEESRRVMEWRGEESRGRGEETRGEWKR